MGEGHAGLDPNGKAITNKTFDEAAKAFGMSVKEAKQSTYKLLKSELEKDAN